tara:strand:+ start:1725 stop:4325 length:2601 start_codon:yes stop_codon:yes gene_type:complete
MVLFFIISNISYSQGVVQGFVKDSLTDVPLHNVNILIKSNKNKLLDFTFTNSKGFYKKTLPKDYDLLYVEVSIIGYKKSVKVIKIIDSNKETYILDFALKERLDELEEVYIEGKKRPITVRQDTTVYNLEKFKDGTERVVEDILKKLPGITVGENGLVKFKGKTVTRLLLDNDNIFDSNYGIGTKNISSDIIEGIEAIEDYNENPLLKGVKSSQNVALNLKLKKGEADISGNTELGLGVDSKKYAKGNALVVSKKAKGFSSVGYNNIGENYSPYNFVSNNIDISRLSELSQRTSNLVNDNGFNSILPDNRVRVNNNFFGSLNALYKLKDNLSLRVNYNLFKDKLIRNESTNTRFIFNNQEININTAENFIKSPLINAGAYELIYKINKKELLTSKGKVDYQKINSASSGFNNEDLFSNKTTSRDVFFNNKIEYTNRFKTSTVFQSSIEISSNDLPQNVNITTDLDNARQQIDFKKNTLDINASLLSKIKKSEYGIKLGYNFDENFVNSDLQGISFNNQNISNDVYYRISKPYLNLDYNHRLGQWNFIANIENEIFNISLIDMNLDTDYNNSFYTINPSLTIQHKLSKVSNLYTGYKLSNQIPDAQNVFSGLILTNNRLFLNNDFSFNLFNNQSFDVGFRVNDFYNLFQFNVYANYNYSKYGYLSQLNINEDLSFSTSIVESVNNKNLQFGFRLEKYLHFLRSTLNLNSNYTIRQYQNIINDSGLRDNTSKNLFVEFKIRTGFKGTLNFENNVFVNNNFFETGLGNSNEFTSFQNDFSVKYIKNSFHFNINTQYFKPDLKQDISGDLFLDASIRLTSKNKKIEYMFKANNLLNQKKYRNINSSDLSTTSFEHNLQERFALFSIGFRF